MYRSLQCIKAYGFKPQWITEDECLNIMQKDKNTAYLCDKFEGDAFEHLKSHGLRILGPICVLTCLELKVEIPRTKVPIHNLAMKDTIISCTNIDKVLRESLHMKVLMMGGEIQRNFTENVTHLVAGMVGSSKYQVASNLKKYIMLPDWVNSVWEASQEGSVHCNDEKFQKYTCPMFKGLIITVSGLESAERKKVKQLVEMEGGVYSGEMKVDECTHLIVNEPKGQKYEFAKQWKIQIVKPQWLYESIETGYCLDETKYQLNTEGGHNEMMTSTPTKNTSAVNLSSIANISAINRLSDTMLSACSSNISRVDKSKPTFDNTSMSTPMSFFDGCKIYLSGFRGPDQERLLRIINVGGGTRFNSLNEHVTHVVMGEKVPADMDYLEKAIHRPHILNASWLLDCVKESKYVPEKPYYIQKLPFVKESHMEPPKAPAPITKRKPVGDVSQLNTTKITATTSEFGENTDEELALMSQYLQGSVMSKSEALQSTFRSNIAPSINNMSNGTLESDQSEMTDPVNTGGIFSGKTFICCGLAEDTPVIENAVIENGGIILKNIHQIPDYALVPLGGCTIKFTANEVVTHVWLESCLEKHRLVPISDSVLFQPIEINHLAKPLTNCVISFSGLNYIEKNCLMYLGKLLGANTQLVFVKKPTKGMLSNTHLVVKEAEGQKYEAAIKWKVHVVKIEWILACAKSGKLEPEDNYICRPVTCKDGVSLVKENNVKNNTCLIENDQNDGNGSLVTKKRTSVSDVRPNHLANDVSTCNDVQQPQCNSIVMEGLASSDNSQKENRHSLSHKQMPVSLHTSRILELQEKESQLSPKENNFQPKIDTETPSKFLGQGKEYHPKFELDDLTSVLESQMKGLSTSHSRRSSIPWGELFSKHIEEGVKISANARTEEFGGSQEVEAVSDKNEGPLNGVVISVARKLSAKQSLYNDMAVSLGADYTWTYDDTCTHFIFQGKQNDINREFRLARDQKKIIVSPYWLIMCKEQNVYVDESLFPHTFNPNLNLQSVMNSSKETPRRKMRSTRTDVCSSTPVAKKTPRVFRHDVEAVPEPEAEEERMEINALLPVTTDEELMELEETKKPDVENAVEMAEIQEALNKELENIKASGSRRPKKRNKKLNSSCNDSLNNRSTPYSTKVIATGKAAEQSSKTSGSESSQSVQVTWYDPTERLEMQKVAAQLERAYCPTQDPLEGFTTTKQDCDDQPTNGNGELNDGGKKISSRTSTPEQPSIVLPLSKKLETVAAPQPIEFLSDDDTQDNATTGTMVESPCFLLSGISPSERVDYGALIEELGGTVIEGQIYHESCTHLVIGCPTRNEKFLACMASGKWILHKSYFEDCRRAKKFVQEAKHEWGSVSTESVLASANSVMKTLAASAQRWRLKIQELKKQSPKCQGAFYDWSVILCTCKKKESNFERLLKAGGAKVLSAKPPFTKPISATHALIDITRADLTTSDLETLLRNNVLCLRPDYIAAYLSNEVLQSPDEFCPPEVIALRASLNLPDSGMRKRKTTIIGEEAKRNRKL
ncbi:DNA topoisomerase 2-binding protein 1-like isoform X1 [Octopus sinensis]|uniref:DNA topoisomerase 2-binding protein 1-like isoform X1 n=1 Tax=Octopus sinensis TaxID=2607531 RepID=A0A6P7T922_9MOLL|nr:DNA topoisomerase 2-binding protein 1-like isoform X1 [Octopus sinensis]